MLHKLITESLNFNRNFQKSSNAAERKCNLNSTNVNSQSIKTNALGEVKTVWNEKEMCISELQTML